MPALHGHHPPVHIRPSDTKQVNPQEFVDERIPFNTTRLALLQNHPAVVHPDKDDLPDADKTDDSAFHEEDGINLCQSRDANTKPPASKKHKMIGSHGSPSTADSTVNRDDSIARHLPSSAAKTWGRVSSEPGIWVVELIKTTVNIGTLRTLRRAPTEPR